jgi:hypothetical protein
MWFFKCHCNWRLVTRCTFDDCSFWNISIDNCSSTKHYTENDRLSKANPSRKLGMNPNVPEWYEFPAPLVASVVLLLHDTTIIWYGNRVENKYTLMNMKNINGLRTPYKKYCNRDEHRF